jgi:abortive infection bacteriophage resistance protein
MYSALFSALAGDCRSAAASVFLRVYPRVLFFSFTADNKKWNMEILKSMEELVSIHQETIRLLHVGFPENWCSLMLKEDNCSVTGLA